MSQPPELTIEQAISRAKKATRQGNIAVAQELYHAVLQQQPDNQIAKKRLRKLQRDLPRNQFEQAPATNPSQDKINLLVNLYHSGQISNTEEACRELLKAYPQSVIVINLLGAVLQIQGKSQAAVQEFDKAIAIDPNFPGFYNDRGVALQGLGQLNEAMESYSKAIELKPDYAEAFSNRGNALRDAGRFREAVENYNKAIKLKPDYAEAYYNLGVALNNLGKTIEAIESYEKVIELKPDDAQVYCNYGTALRGAGRLMEAMRSFNKAIELKTNFVEAYNNRGNVYRDLRQMEEAVKSYDKAIELKTDYAEAYNNRGKAFGDLGRFKKAVGDYERAVNILPDFAEAHRNLSALKTYEPGVEQIGVMEERLADPETDESDRIYYFFALAKAYDDVGEYDKSFSCLYKGNHLRKKELNYNINNDIKIFSKLKRIFSERGVTTDTVSYSNASMKPIFIVGMLRSGTSLVEQILASHSKVYGAGEIGFMDQLVTPVFSKLANQHISQDMNKIFQIECNVIQSSYLEALTALNVTEKIITDKMPTNFLWIGFILSAFPNAKIIHLNRDPRATCWSIYKHYFPSEGNGYAYDLVDLVEYYKLYTDLLSFWRKRHPDSIYDISYENLTENQEEETRRLLTYCDLEWESQCLDFHNTRRVVQTASAIQVREKMYTGSSEAWRNYEEHLQPLIDGLGYID